MSILIVKFWYVVCAIFCLYNLNTLVKERHEVAILAANRSETDPIVYLVCKELSRFQLKKTEIVLEELRNQLVNHFSRVYSPYVWNSLSKELVLSRLKTGEYLIFSGLLCIPLNEKDDKRSMAVLLYPPVFFAFRKSTLDFAPMASLSTSFDQMIVQKKGAPYSSCSESNGRFRCLNECFKNNFRLSRYLYEGNETGLIQLKPVTNRTIEENERSCFEECQKENCKIVQLSPIPSYGKPEVTTLEARPKLSEFDYWVEFIGLVCSFANISLNQLTSLVITFASSKVKRRRVRIGLFCLKWAILFLSLVCCGYLYTITFMSYKADERTPPRKEITRNQIKQKTVRLAICVNIIPYLTGYRYFLDINSLNKTMWEIEKVTDKALNDHLESIHLDYQGRSFRANYIPEPNVLFKKFINLDKIHIFSRCFVLLILPDYKLMPFNPKLTIKLRGDTHNIKFYILTENENLNEETFDYIARTFMKRVVKRLEGEGCVNYQERYGNCTRRPHCIERCINREALEKFENKIAIEKAVVDKDQFSPEEWNTTYPMQIPSSGQNRSQYKNLSEKCEKKFPVEKHCIEVKFTETVQIFQPDQTKEIDLFVNVKLSIEEFSWFKLLLNLMNIQGIFFNLTVLKLLRMIHRFFKQKLRIRNDKFAQFLTYLLCSIGFTWHTYRILDLTINEELTYSQDYEILNRVRMPVLVFCLPIEEKLIDRNHQLTGRYLEQLTSDMTTKSVFKSILYLNETNEWIPFNLSLVEPFFFLRLKCFRIKIYREYDRRQFHFSENSQIAKVLKVNFTGWLLDWIKSTIFFMTKTNETEFSNIVDLLYDYDFFSDGTGYSAEQSELTVKYEDHLSFIRRFLSTSYEDDFDDLDGQLPELKSSEFSFRTLKVPVEKEDFDFELQEDFFEQLSTQIKIETTRNWLDSLDYQQKFVFNQLKEDNGDFVDSDFFLSLSLIKKSQSAKNEAKLILGLLNVLFWFDLGILDLHPIFVYFYSYFYAYLLVWLPIYLIDKITQFLIFSHRWLKKFEAPLYKRLDSRKQIARQTPQV